MIVSYLSDCPADPSDRFAYFAMILARNRSWPTPLLAREWGVVFAKIALLYAADSLQSAFSWTAITVIFEKDRLAGSFAERIQAADALRRARDRGASAANGSLQDIHYQTYQIASQSLTTFLPALAEDELDRTLLDEAVAIGEEQLHATEPPLPFGYAPSYSNTASALLRRHEWTGRRADLDQAVTYSTKAADLARKCDKVYRYRKQELAYTALARRFMQYQQESDLDAALILARDCLFGTGGVDKWAVAAICKLQVLAYSFDLVHNLVGARKALSILLDEIPSEPEVGFLSIVVDLFSGNHVEIDRVDSVLAAVQDKTFNLTYALEAIQARLSPSGKGKRVPLVGGPIEARPLALIPFAKDVDGKLAELAVEVISRSEHGTVVNPEAGGTS
jgi:hypothetical protein